MKVFEPLAFDRQQCRKEVLELRDLLTANASLKERSQVLPFFKQRKHLSAFVASYLPPTAHFDRLAHEYQLFGDFACDLVAGDSIRKCYAFVEFEDATAGSIFVKKKKKSTPEWSPRFEHGFSQIVDWLFKFDEQRSTVAFEERFGARAIQYIGLLVVGRREALGPREVERLRWRQEFVLVNSKHVQCVTFDQLCEHLLVRLIEMPYVAAGDQAGPQGLGGPA